MAHRSVPGPDGCADDLGPVGSAFVAAVVAPPVPARRGSSDHPWPFPGERRPVIIRAAVCCTCLTSVNASERAADLPFQSSLFTISGAAVLPPQNHAMHRFVGILGLALCFASPDQLNSQARKFELRPGEKIEIAAPTLGGDLVPATVLHWEPSWTAFVLEDGEVWTRHMYDVKEVRVHRVVPLRSRLRSGVAWGVFLGTSLGGIAAPFAANALNADVSDWGAVSISAAAGGIAGASIGTLIGAAITRSAWNHYLFRAPSAEP